MIIWLNGAFGSGKTTCAFELNRRLPNSFVYDPENIGYFIRNNTPKEIHKSNFQDNEQWRLFNYEMLKYLYYEYKGIIIVPMTIFNRCYYDEIIQKLIDDDIPVKHFILYASKETLKKRLRKRLELSNTWANKQIDNCINAFNLSITEEKIETDDKTVDEILDEIAIKTGISLLSDKRSGIKKMIDKILTLIKHIR